MEAFVALVALLGMFGAGLCAVAAVVVVAIAVPAVWWLKRRRLEAAEKAFVASLPPPTSIEPIVLRSFRPKSGTTLDFKKYEVHQGDDALVLAAEGVAMSGQGLDLLAGERPLGAMLISETFDNGGFLRGIAVITTHEFYMGCFSSSRGGINGNSGAFRHDAWTDFKMSVGLVGGESAFETAQGPVGGGLIYFYTCDKSVKTAALHLKRLPPDQRVTTDEAALATSREDPYGVQAVRDGLWQRADRTLAWLDRLESQLASGALSPEDGRRALLQLLIADRSQLVGPAGRNGRYFVPMTHEELMMVITLMLGAKPTTVKTDPLLGFTTASFPLGIERIARLRGGDLANAFLSGTMLGGIERGGARVLARALVGALSTKTPLTSIDVQMWDEADGVAYALVGNGQPLQQQRAMELATLVAPITAMALEVVGFHVEHGHTTPVNWSEIVDL